MYNCIYIVKRMFLELRGLNTLIFDELLAAFASSWASHM